MKMKTKMEQEPISLKKVLTNDDLSQIVETNHEWIFERTGIAERRICSTEGGEWPTDMAEKALGKALKNANLSENDIDMIIFASVTPDMKLPNSATILQTKLGITNKCTCLDIAVACSGFCIRCKHGGFIYQNRDGEKCSGCWLRDVESRSKLEG